MKRPMNSIYRTISLYNKFLETKGIVVNSRVMLEYTSQYHNDITVTEAELLMILGDRTMSSTDISNESLLHLTTAQNGLTTLENEGYVKSFKVGRTRLWKRKE